MRVWSINGPNLNRTGVRQTDVYGTRSWAELEAQIVAYGRRVGVDVTVRQSNAEGQLIDWLQAADSGSDGVILNAGGLSHTSVALADAVGTCAVPVVEVHLSNILGRETFRHHSLTGAVSRGVICGLGIMGYELAIDALFRLREHGHASD